MAHHPCVSPLISADFAALVRPLRLFGETKSPRPPRNKARFLVPLVAGVVFEISITKAVALEDASSKQPSDHLKVAFTNERLRQRCILEVNDPSA
jgi:hypothetical protein